MARSSHKFNLGVFYKTLRPIYHRELYRDHHPLKKRLSRETRFE